MMRVRGCAYMCAPTSIMAVTIALHSSSEYAAPRGAPTLIPSFEVFASMGVLLSR